MQSKTKDIYVMNLERWKFHDDSLLMLVLDGKKKATSSLYDEENKSSIGDYSIITDKDNNDKCLIKITDIKIYKFKDVSGEIAVLEGEDNKTVESWKNVHERFFKEIDNNFNDDTLIQTEIFDVIKKCRR